MRESIAAEIVDDPKWFPLLFSGPMIRALLAGTKTQTRRIVSAHNTLLDGGSMPRKVWPELQLERAFVDPGPSPAGNAGPYLQVPRYAYEEKDQTVHRVYPIWQRADSIWVKETAALIWPHDSAPEDERECVVEYRADGDPRRFPGQWPSDTASDPERPRWRPSIFCKRWMSRITLDVISVRVERLQSITEEDARAEGVAPYTTNTLRMVDPEAQGPKWRPAFEDLWDEINGERASWASNPWIWAIEFKRVDAKAAA